MTKSKAIVLAVFTAWPLLYVILFIGMVLSMMLPGVYSSWAGSLASPLKVIVPLHVLTMLDVVILLVIYMLYLFRTDAVAKEKKVLWATVLFLGNIVAMPVFWYVYIWKGESLP